MHPPCRERLPLPADRLAAVAASDLEASQEPKSELAEAYCRWASPAGPTKIQIDSAGRKTALAQIGTATGLKAEVIIGATPAVHLRPP